MGWEPAFSGPLANSIPLSGITVKSGNLVGRPMPRLDQVRKLAAAMVKCDLATRHLQQAWQALLGTNTELAECPHPQLHNFPSLPLTVEGVVLFGFPVLEMCVVCGLPLAAYPGVPHPLAEVGYPKLK